MSAQKIMLSTAFTGIQMNHTKTTCRFLPKIFLKFILLFIAAGLISACASVADEKIVRHQIHPWEVDIGYSQVVKHGTVFYFSGVTCGGPTDEAALPMCYQALDDVLQKMHLTREKIIQETIYARDIESLKRQIPFRKKWYGEHFPAATWVQVDRLYDESHRFEIELVVSE
jgi:2-iminobutanoate/2-iminopropanoate deaminase